MIGLPSPNANAKPTNQNAIEPEKNKKLVNGDFVKEGKESYYRRNLVNKEVEYTFLSRAKLQANKI